MSKHLCGVATDLSLRCLHAYAHTYTHESDASCCATSYGEGVRGGEREVGGEGGGEGGANGVPLKGRVGGICIALCCHHLVKWHDYTGQDFFRCELGWGEADFERVKKACSWATICRSKNFKEGAKGGGEGGRRGGAEEGSAGAEEGGGGLSAVEKEEVGRCCKRLLDVGRLWYVRHDMGLEAELVCYAPQSLTLENVLLLAYPKPV